MCVGKTYGENPLDNVAEIRNAKTYEADNIVKLLSLTKTDTVVDLGSGCGFIARALAPKVKKLYCLDISQDFLNYCKQETHQNNNVECHVIGYANFAPLNNQPINAIYATALFIHFNLYDMYHYIKACYDCLAPGGRLLFDFLNLQRLNIEDDTFKRHATAYLNNREELFVCIYYNHPDAVEKIYTQIGFKLSHTKIENNHCFVVLEK
jgi:cyclopropane fatty-acyl-phospholipid synthase-like methyltransferase